jgi:hypothetical protein
LPNQSTFASSVKVQACVCPPAPEAPAIDRSWWQCEQGAGPVAVIIANYINLPGYTYSMATTGNIVDTGVFSSNCVPAPPQPDMPGAAAFYVRSNASSARGNVTVTVTLPLWQDGVKYHFADCPELRQSVPYFPGGLP